LDLIEFSAHKWHGRIKRCERGVILYWQGDPVDQIFIILSGAVKESSIAASGKVISFDISGAGRLLGARPYLLGGEHRAVAEVLETAELASVPTGEFEAELSTNREFSAGVMRELALEASSAADKARDLSFLDVQQRLKHSLMNLAEKYGIPTGKGVRIDLNITQEDIGALVAANRSTIAACLSDLKAQGYLWKEGRRLVVIPPQHMETLEALTRSITEGDDTSSERWGNGAVAQGIDPLKILEALTAGMRLVDRQYTLGEIELPDVVLAAAAMKQVLPLVEAGIESEHEQESVVGTVVIGTVQGDIHDLGKLIVAMLLRARNFRVIDLGVNVAAEQFIQALRQFKPDILALSALTTATALEIEPVVHLLAQEGMRNKVKLMVGGGAVSKEYAARIGADGYHLTAQGAVETAWRLCTWK
jgi:trimethylamine corrinoid protein